MEEVSKIKYSQVENFELIKDAFLSKVQLMKGNIPDGFDNDIFLSAFIKIHDYLTKKYQNVKLKKSDIPDVARFEEREEYSVSQFIFNRIINNIEKVNVASNVQTKVTCGGRYNFLDKSLEIFPNNIKTATDFEFEKYKTLNFASSEDFNKMVTEYFIIHELIHAISFDDFSVGFHLGDESVSINEGFTDSLALEISGFGNFFQYLPQQLDNNSYYMIPKNSVSSYTVETNIADLIRIVSPEDLTIPYLICGEKVKWANIDRFYDASCYPISKNQDVYGFLEKELHEIVSKESNLSKEERVTRLQNLQGYLINDILKNKYNKKFMSNIASKNITYEQALQYDQDIATIMNKIVLSFPEETAKQVLMYGAQSLEIWDVTKLENMMKNGEIKDSNNLQKYVELMKMRIELQKTLAQQREENITV